MVVAVTLDQCSEHPKGFSGGSAHWSETHCPNSL